MANRMRTKTGELATASIWHGMAYEQTDGVGAWHPKARIRTGLVWFGLWSGHRLAKNVDVDIPSLRGL